MELNDFHQVCASLPPSFHMVPSSWAHTFLQLSIVGFFCLLFIGWNVLVFWSAKNCYEFYLVWDVVEYVALGPLPVFQGPGFFDDPEIDAFVASMPPLLYESDEEDESTFVGLAPQIVYVDDMPFLQQLPFIGVVVLGFLYCCAVFKFALDYMWKAPYTRNFISAFVFYYFLFNGILVQLKRLFPVFYKDSGDSLYLFGSYLKCYFFELIVLFVVYLFYYVYDVFHIANCIFSRIQPLFYYRFIPIRVVIPLGPPRYSVPAQRRKDVKKFKISTRQSFVTRDFDFVNNGRAYGLVCSSEQKFYGQTVVDGRTYSFPTHGCRRTFLTFIFWMETHIPYNDRARFIIEGICTPQIFDGYRYVYNPLSVDRVEGLAPGLREVEWICLAVGIAYHAYNRDMASLAILLGSHASYVERLLPLLGISDSADLPTILCDLFKPKSERSDVIQRSKMAKELKAMFVEDDEDPVVVALSPFQLFGLLPDAVKKSPVISKSVALITVVAFSSFASNSAYVPAILKNIDYSGITEKAFCAGLLYQVISAVWTGLTRFAASGDYMDLLGVPGDTRFVREASALLYATDMPLSAAQVKNNIAQAQRLITSRDYCVGSNPAIDRLVVKLHEYVKDRHEFLLALEPRTEPVVLFFKGAPGTGKTTFIDATRSFLNKLDGVEAFPGDTIVYNLYNKFPIESGAHRCARFLVINDIADDYTDFDKKNLMPLDTLLQQAIDTFSFEINSAAVENKGKVFNAIRYVILTSNHRSYKMSSDATKLKRRFASGVFASVEFLKGDYDASKKQSVEERNSSIIIGRMNVVIKNKYMAFDPTVDPPLSYVTFFKYVEERVKAHFRHAEAQFNLLFAPDSTCACGVPVVMHYSDEDRLRDPSLLSNPTWNAITDKCVLPKPKLAPVPEKTFWEKASVRYGEQKIMIRDLYDNRELSWFNAKRRVANLIPESLSKRLVDIRQSIEARVHEKAPADFEPTTLWYRFTTWLIPDTRARTVPLSPAMIAVGFFGAIVLPMIPGWVESGKKAYASCRDYGYERTLACYVSFQRAENELKRMVGFRSMTSYHMHESKLRAIEFTVDVINFVRRYKTQVALFLGSAAIATLLYTYFNRKTDVSLGGGMSRFTVDEASMQTVVQAKPQHYEPSSLRTWARTDPIVHFELQSRGVGFGDLVSMCQKSMMTASFEVTQHNGKKGYFAPRVVFLNSDYVACNKHYFQDDAGKFWPETLVTIRGIPCLVTESELTIVPNSEVVLFKNVWLPSTPNILKKFGSGIADPGQAHELVVLYEDKGNFSTTAYPTIISLHGVSYPALKWSEKGKIGDCGTLALARHGGDWYIAGMIAFGESVRGEIVSVGISTISWKDFPTTMALGYPLVNDFLVPGLPRVLGPLSNNSEFAQSPNLFLTPFGTEVGATNRFKSKIHKTMLYDEVAPKLSQPYSQPDRISRTVKNEDGSSIYFSAWRSTFKHMNLPDLSNFDIAYRAMSSFVKDCAAAVEKQTKKVELHPLSLFEAFWGHESLKVDGVVMKTSLGVTWREAGYKDKHDLFDENPETGKFHAKEEFVASVDRLIRDLHVGVIRAPLAEFVPKDEVRSQEKIDACKIRLFSVLDFDINAVFRMYAMPIINFLLDNPEYSECYGGINAGSIQWTHLAHRLKKMGFYTDLDFSAFDTSHGLKFMLLVAMFFRDLSLVLGYTTVEADVLFLIVRSLTFQVMKYLCDYFGKIKGMPSGVIITLILNSIINSILMRMAFIILVTAYSVFQFREHVAAATVGDDNVSGISKEIIEVFNPIVMKPLYESWGYVVTPASKGSEFQRDLPFEDLVFIKRKFVLWSDGWYRAPLDKDSLFKALAFQGDSTLSMSARLVSVYESMVREAYMHGEDFFNEYYGWIRELFIKHRLAAAEGEEILSGMAKPYHFENLNAIFLEGTFRTFMC